jgi:hypothetical protein
LLRNVCVCPDDGNWVGITSTVYVASDIPEATLNFTPNIQPPLNIDANRSHISHQIADIISSLQKIKMSGDFGGGYPYSYSHQMVYGIGTTRELAWESTIQASGMLARGNLNTVYQRDDNLLDRYCDRSQEKINDVFDRYVNITKLFKQELTNPIVYRISSWNSENIYIIGEMKESSQSDSSSVMPRLPCSEVGIYIKSNFVYNP